MCDGLVDYLNKHGVQADNLDSCTFVVYVPSIRYPNVKSYNSFSVENGIVCCYRGDKLNLAKPDSLRKLVAGAKHCSKNQPCTKCPFRESDWINPRKIPLALYDHIGWKCEGHCDDLCGHFGIMCCPLK